MNIIETEFKGQDPSTFKKVSMQELLELDKQYEVSLTCDSKNGVWQYYFVCTGVTYDEGYFIRIKRDDIVKYLNRREETNDK